MSRYRDHGDRADLAICGDCSTRTTLVVVDREEIPEHDVWHEASKLHDAWQEALRLQRAHDHTFGTDEAEQTAYDALVDFVEANGLNYTDLDPRGPAN